MTLRPKTHGGSVRSADRPAVVLRSGVGCCASPGGAECGFEADSVGVGDGSVLEELHRDAEHNR